MTTFKLIGLSDDEAAAISNQVNGFDGETAGIEDIGATTQDELVWVVALSQAASFVAVARTLADQSRPRAILLLPTGDQTMPDEDWWEVFDAEVATDDSNDLALLGRVGQCRRVLDWPSLLQEIPADWFIDHSAQVFGGDLSDLPVSDEELEHLATCQHCQEEIRNWLQDRSTFRRTYLCPSTMDVVVWLEGPSIPDLERHIRTCDVCRDGVRRQAWLWASTPFTTDERVRDRLRSVNLLQEEPELSVLVQALVDWQLDEIRKYMAAQVLITSLRHMAVRRSWRDASAPIPLKEDGIPTSIEADLLADLTNGLPVTLLGDEQWIDLTLDGDDLLVRVGTSPIEPFQSFLIDFLSGDALILSIPSENGIVRLSSVLIEQARQGQADRLAVRYVPQEKGP